jgi:phosphoglycerate kinase
LGKRNVKKKELFIHKPGKIMNFNDLKIPIIQNADLKGKIVLVRVDHNVVKKGVIKDPYRIESTFGTIAYILAKGGKPILMTHAGRPKDKATGNIKIADDSAVDPIVNYLRKKLKLSIMVPDFTAVNDNGYMAIDTSVNLLINKLRSGEIDMIYMPNTRWFYGEERKDETADILARQFAGLADVFVNDAFGSYRPHVSVVGPTKYLPSYAGFLMQKEIENLDHIYYPDRPFVAVVAGSKFDTKIETLNKLLEVADKLVLGGVMYNTYLTAKYDIKIKGVSEEDTKSAKKFAEHCTNCNEKLVELPYIIESDTLEGRFDGQYRVRAISELKAGDELNYVLDVSKNSFADSNVKQIFHSARLFFINAVMGFTPNFTEGTIALDRLVHENRSASKLFGGGDTLQEMKILVPDLYMEALDDPSYYMFTGGGAVLKAIQEGEATGMDMIKALIGQ